jgi:hypothetical protein
MNTEEKTEERAEERVEAKEETQEKQERKRTKASEMNEITCGLFQYSTGEELTTVCTRWEMWLERFKMYVHAKDLEEERIKSTFLLMIGFEAFKSIRGKEDKETPEQAYKLLTDHFTARRSEFAEEQRFRHMKRNSGEPIHDYVMRLRQQAIH